MELRQLRYFTEAAEQLNFTEAARNMCITQSTLSQQIKQLEEELDILLFDRIGKRVLLTEAGESFLPYAKKTLQEAESGKQIIMDLQNIEGGTLRIGVTYSLSPLLTNAIILFTKRHPAVKLEIQYRSSGDLLELLKNHKVDVILSFKPAVEEPHIESTVLFESSLSLVVHRFHPLAALKSISLERLSNEPLILLSKGYTARAMLDHQLEQKGIHLNPAVELNEVNILLQLVKSGRWATVLSKATIFGQSDLKAIPLATKSSQMNAALLSLKDVYKKKSMLAFTKLLLNISVAHG
ncbi:MAG: LysR substrate-binding domain-containing protein [Bacteroidales bacterium]